MSNELIWIYLLMCAYKVQMVLICMAIVSLIVLIPTVGLWTEGAVKPTKLVVWLVIVTTLSALAAAVLPGKKEAYIGAGLIACKAKLEVFENSELGKTALQYMKEELAKEGR